MYVLHGNSKLLVEVLRICFRRLISYQGGIKAVLWADALQCVVMVAGVMSVLGAALWSIGGFDVMRTTTADGGRNNILK